MEPKWERTIAYQNIEKKLEPCPFSHQSAPYIEEKKGIGIGLTRYRVVCDECDEENRFDIDAVVARWNTRPTVPEGLPPLREGPRHPWTGA